MLIFDKRKRTERFEKRFRKRIGDSQEKGRLYMTGSDNHPEGIRKDDAEFFCDHFSGVSAGYAEFRPTYPDTLFRWLASVSPSRRVAWDCATGSGQAAPGLAAWFDRVMATDASSSQIGAATPHPRVEYRVASAESSGIRTRTVDLVTVAQALHWFNRERFFSKAGRVLVQDGVLAVWSYGRISLGDDHADEVVQDFYHGAAAPYWPPERSLVDSGYSSIRLPFEDLDVPDFEMTAQGTCVNCSDTSVPGLQPPGWSAYKGGFPLTVLNHGSRAAGETGGVG